MANAKDAFIKLLKEDIDHNRKMIEAWKEIEDDGGWLDTEVGKITPGEIMKRCRNKIDELQSLIEKIK